jgi:hypothetical protein
VLMGWPDCVSMHYWHGLGWVYRTYVGNAHAEDKRGYASHTDDGPERQLDATVRCWEAQERHGNAALDERSTDGVKVLGDVE